VAWLIVGSYIISPFQDYMKASYMQLYGQPGGLETIRKAAISSNIKDYMKAGRQQAHKKTATG
jgi:hypothetical protein